MFGGGYTMRRNISKVIKDWENIYQVALKGLNQKG